MTDPGTRDPFPLTCDLCMFVLSLLFSFPLLIVNLISLSFPLLILSTNELWYS